MAFSNADADRLLQPGNLGLRVFVAMGKVAPGCEGSETTVDKIIADLHQWERQERDEALVLIQALDQVVSDLVVERGGYVPERCV